MMEWIKFIHVMFGVTLFGALIASYFYVRAGVQSEDVLRAFTVKRAIKIDYFVFLPVIVMEFITGSLLVPARGFTYTTPWIVGAYTLLALIFVLTIVSAKNKTNKKIFNTVNIVMIIFFATIIHDAVMKHTILGHFLR